MTADQAKAVAETVGQQLQNEWMTTYKVLNAVPEGKDDFKPEPNARSAGELARHIATSDLMFLAGILQGKFGEWQDDSAGKSLKQLTEEYKHAFPQQQLEHVLALDGTKLAQDVEFFGMTFPAVHYMVWTLTHMVHHRGQLSTYLRPMGGKVPSIYGGSFDEPYQG